MVVTSTVSSISTLASTVLRVAEESLADTAGGTPLRSFISPTPPVWDCAPQLTVQVVRISEETTSPFAPPAATGQRAAFGRLNLVTFNITVIRDCSPWNGNNAPDATLIETTAREVEEDMWALWNGIYTSVKDGDLADLCEDVHYDFARSLPQQADYVGSEMVFRIELGGYRP
jgi:hypothetical protein